jgi:hypothetical protein
VVRHTGLTSNSNPLPLSQIVLLPTNVIVMWPIVVSALAPCQWRSPALICAISPTLISHCSYSVATMPVPEVTIRSDRSHEYANPVVHP